MTTKTLKEMVDMVSSILTDLPVNIKTISEKNIITISTPAWDFYFHRLDDVGVYIYEECITNNSKLAENKDEVKQQLLREVISKYFITNTL